MLDYKKSNIMRLNLRDGFKVPKDRYELEASEDEVKKLKNSKLCFNNKPHLINKSYWNKENDDFCYCSNPGCDFSFKKGHKYILPEGFILVK